MPAAVIVEDSDGMLVVPEAVTLVAMAWAMDVRGDRGESGEEVE